MTKSMMTPGQEPRQNGAASLSDPAGNGGVPIGISVACSQTVKPPREGGDAEILDTTSPVVRTLLEIAPPRWRRSIPADAFRATE